MKETSRRNNSYEAGCQIGKIFAGYQIIEELGRGGAGRVYRAFHLQLKRMVALKLLITKELSKSSDVENFLREARVTASLKHPNIVTLFDIGYEDHQPFFTMELIEGQTLKDTIYSKKLSILRIAQIMIEIADAIAYAHSCKIIHRDLKPANILFDEGTPKIVDFGLAKENQNSTEFSKTGIIAGTLRYLSPEQIKGTPPGDQRVDIYAMGVILYELLTTRPCFLGKTNYDILYKVIHETLPPPSKINPDVPKDLENICLKAIAKDRQQRYFSAEEFVADLRRFSQGECVTASSPGIFSRIWRTAKKHRSKIAVFCLFAFTSLFFYHLGHLQANSASQSTNSASQSTNHIEYSPAIPRKEPSSPELPSTLQGLLPSEIWQQCHCVHQNEQILDMTSSYWQKLTTKQQQELMSLYQQNYAVRTSIPVKFMIQKNGVEFLFHLVPPGRFWMGELLPVDDGRETPRHTVTISQSYYMLKHEVNQEQWQAIMKSNPAHFTGKYLPVESVDWNECQQFCQATQFSLPTEAQWEYACRAGVTARYHWGKEWQPSQINSASYWLKKDVNNMVEWKRFQNQWRNLGAGTTIPENFMQNAFGLYQMHGNVWEWCQDWYESYNEYPSVDPIGPDYGSFKVYRGGSWRNAQRKCTSTYRGGLRTDYKSFQLGFRVVVATPR